MAEDKEEKKKKVMVYIEFENVTFWIFDFAKVERRYDQYDVTADSGVTQNLFVQTRSHPFEYTFKFKTIELLEEKYDGLKNKLTPFGFEFI